MRQGHQGHTERRNRDWNPRTEPTARERDVLRVIASLPEGVKATTLELTARLGINRATLQRHRARLTDMGLVEIVPQGSLTHVQLTEAGRQCVGLENRERAA